MKKSVCLSGFIAAMQLKCVHVFTLFARVLALFGLCYEECFIDTIAQYDAVMFLVYLDKNKCGLLEPLFMMF